MKNWIQIPLVILFLLFFGFSSGIGIYTDWLWFKSLGYSSVYLTILSTKIWLALLVGAVFFAFAYINLRIATRGADAEGEEEILLPSRVILLLGLIVMSLFVGLIASSGWDTILRYLDQAEFGVLDPIFARDIGFYAFTLPFYEFVWNGLFYGLILVGVSLVIIYSLQAKAILVDREATDITFGIPQFSSSAIAHVSFVGALLLLVVAWGYRLDMFQLLYSARGVVYGATYTDANVQLPVLKILIALSILTALSLLVNVWFRKLTLPIVAFGLLIAVSILGGSVYPNLIQQYRVLPNELVFETPYIERNIDYTAQAYGLDDVKERQFIISYNLTAEDIQKNDATIQNIRIWDNRPLKSTYKQLQEIRTYYTFQGVDIDRYNMNGEYRQVMLSPRELSQSELAPEARTWVNEHLVFTHGYGVVVSPVNRVIEGGLPDLLIKDIPPVSSVDITVDRPEIYYGELANEYVVVKTKQLEFDYPKGDINVETSYEGRGGVLMDSFVKKAAIAFRFSSVKLFLTDSITRESRIMFYRDIQDRVRIIAPFLKYDRDPYIVISDGKLYWIQDAYTVMDRYPYSDPYGGINYIRNSVKVVIDAYNGDVAYYVIDDKDAIIRTYMDIFPELFKPFEEMPEGLRGHIRYPEDLFTIQATMYMKYHMKDPKVFYNQEDLWVFPMEVYEGNERQMEPYSVIVKLPDEEKEEFMLILPLTPRGKKNMIAWMAAKSDWPDYGQLVLYKFPKEELTFGPMQIEARIDQTPEISERLTLWGQSGSVVTRGNLLVIPIEDSLLYVEPLYIRAEISELPELKRVLVAYENKIAMEEDLERALDKIFGVRVEAPPELKEGEVEEEITKEELIDKALEHYEKAQEYLKQGDWAGYGEELEKLREALERLKGTSE